MNGEHQLILDAVSNLDKRLAVSEALQEERHKENQKDMNGLGEMNRSLTKHCNEIGKLKVHTRIHWLLLAAVAVALILN